MSRARILLLFVILFTSMVFLYLFYFTPMARVATGFTAKKLCSCHFIANRSQADIETRELQTSPVNKVTNYVNETEKTVTSSLFGVSRTAYYTEAAGCSFFPNKSKGIQATEATAVDTSTTSTVIPQRNLQPDVQALLHNAFGQHPENDAILVLKDNTIVGEHYREGIDAATPLLGWSMTKSLTVALVGHAKMLGFLSETDTQLFDQWTDQRSSVSLDDLLRMQSNLLWEEDYTQVSTVTNMLFEKADVAEYLVSLEADGEPKALWEYSSGSTNLVSAYLEKKLGDKYQPFIDSFLKSEMEMPSFLVEQDGAGLLLLSSYGFANIVDWARLGTLFLQRGRYGDTELFTEDWYDYLTTKTPSSTADKPYGAHVWLNTGQVRYPNLPADMFFFAGYEEQRVFIFPSEQVVVVRFGINQTSDYDFEPLLVELLQSLAD